MFSLLNVKCRDIDDPSLRVKGARTPMTPQKKIGDSIGQSVLKTLY